MEICVIVYSSLRMHSGHREKTTIAWLWTQAQAEQQPQQVPGVSKKYIVYQVKTFSSQTQKTGFSKIVREQGFPQFI